MGNNYFQFKQFRVNQDKSAMKVCTDACLFGAWVASKVNAERVLDIGTGTGLLSLMIAQKTNSVIDAIEIDENAAKQAYENFQLSPWPERLEAIHVALQAFNKNNYDLIVSNPPFYANDLKSADPAKNMALHSETLNLHELLSAVETMLSVNGVFAVLLPVRRAVFFEQLLSARGLYIVEKLSVQQTPRHTPFRVCYLISRSAYDVKNSEITIKDEHDQYTDTFDKLLKDYYL